MDDILLLGNNKQLLGKLKKQQMDRFEMTDLGDMSKVLGMNVTRERKNATITIDRKDHTEDILEATALQTATSPLRRASDRISLSTSRQTG